MIVLDTTILVYAVGAEHPAREPSRRLLDALGTGLLVATTTIDVIQEFVHVYARRRSGAGAVELARRYATLLAPLLVPGEPELDRGLELFESHTKLGAFDAVLAASALSHDAEALLSADRAFSSIPELRCVVPGSPAFESLLHHYITNPK